MTLTLNHTTWPCWPLERKPASDWPQRGQIEFDSVSLSYGDTRVLKKISFEIQPRQKIGIIGRTGAGKSSIVAALFRMVEPEGDIYIDGVRTKGIGLHDLRQSISIIPQDPQLFSGTVRYNLDPFDKYEDCELWEAIEQVKNRRIGVQWSYVSHFRTKFD